MSAYDALAPWYDAFTGDVDYESFADFYEALFRADGGEFSLVLDLCCGTGTLALIMSRRGYDMIAADASEDMLMAARDKAADMGSGAPLFICQRADGLDLFGTVDAAYSSLDSFNYLSFEELCGAFDRLRLFIRPGGLLVFDLRTPEFLRSMDGSVSVDETDDALCLWRGRFDHERGELVYGLDLFERVGEDIYEHRNEEHVEYAHDIAAVAAELVARGFTEVRTGAPGPMAGEGRVFITAKRGD